MPRDHSNTNIQFLFKFRTELTMLFLKSEEGALFPIATIGFSVSPTDFFASGALSCNFFNFNIFFY
jgi:hypothetical protein